MITFLQEIAAAIQQEYSDWENLVVIFPNRRAALYFRKALAQQLTKPKWAPAVLTIEEFITSFSSLREADKLSLIVKLYRSFKNVTGSDENFDHFYFWGEMLLRDFDEVDKYLAPAAGLFKDLSNQKELDEYFDYLTDEQKAFLKEFWQSVEFTDSSRKEQFLHMWRNLYPVYEDFRSNLKKESLAYAGMIHREVAENIGAEASSPYLTRQVVFAGFNALTVAEERIMSWFVANKKAKVYWDEDEYYVGAKHREAGAFFRQYRQHPVLGNTFGEPKALLNQPDNRKIRIIGVPQKAGQPKLLAQELEGLLKKEAISERTVIVLPDESLLLPVLYAIPSSIDSINVTMGYPLVNTPYYSLIDFLFDLHLHKRKDEFYYRYVLSLLNHPYIKSRAGKDAVQWKEFILKKNQVHIAPDFFDSKNDLLQFIFQSVAPEGFITYVLGIIQQLATSKEEGGLMEKEFAFYFHRILSRLQELMAAEPMDLKMQQRMFRQIVRSEKVPFSGEPLKGLQIMGVLETRNLDFDRVIVLTLNEGLWPASPRQGSYIPHNIRKAYALPTAEHQDAMYAYLFYRLLQRSQHVDLYYNTEPDVLGMGEMSRYLYQILYETNWSHERQILYNPVRIHPSESITIQKTPEVLEKMRRYEGKALTPSTLNTYIECRLKFYFKHLIEIREPEEVEEEADARIFGNIFHKVMELFYTDIKPPAGPWQISAAHFDHLDTKLERLIERAFRSHFFLPDGKKFEYDGRQLVVKEMVKRFAIKVLTYDKAYAPFEIELLEANYFNIKWPVVQSNGQRDIVLGGKIDRVDRKDSLIRILDYKTGKDENKFASVASLFDRDPNRNKAAFQALFYALVYRKRSQEAGLTIQPGLINRKEIFRNDFEYGLYLDKHRLMDVQHLLPEFEEHLKTLLTELFNPKQSFDQTTDLKTCSYCLYKEICSRS